MEFKEVDGAYEFNGKIIWTPPKESEVTEEIDGCVKCRAKENGYSGSHLMITQVVLYGMALDCGEH